MADMQIGTRERINTFLANIHILHPFSKMVNIGQKWFKET